MRKRDDTLVDKVFRIFQRKKRNVSSYQRQRERRLSRRLEFFKEKEDEETFPPRSISSNGGDPRRTRRGEKKVCGGRSRMRDAAAPAAHSTRGDPKKISTRYTTRARNKRST